MTSSSGCSRHKAPPYTAVTRPALATDINGGIPGLYPDTFKAVHHVILTLAGKDYVLNGYLFIDRPNREIKLMAQNDLGGIVFDVHYIENTKKMIRTNIAMLKKEWLEKSAVRDLEMLYLMKPFPSPALYSDPRGNLILSQKNGRMTRELGYQQINGGAGYRLNRIRLLENSNCIYTVHLKYGTDTGNRCNGYPELILIKDTKMKYELKINVRYFM